MTHQVAAYETPIALDRDSFMRRLIASLGHLNEGILGSEVTGAYIMNVGLSMGAAIEAEYKRFWKLDRAFTVDEYAHVIVDLKQKIHGNFSLVSKSSSQVVVRTTSCPFDEFVRQSPSLCFMTSSVFGGIAARNFGYAKVALNKRIALGDPGCYVSVYLKPTPEAQAAVGREYVPDIDRASPDIAEQLHLMERVRQLRRQLSETSEQWQGVVDHAAEAICLLDTGATIEFANARWRDMLGVEGAELVGARLAQLLHPGDVSLADELVTTVLRGGRVTGRLLRLPHRDTSWRDVRVSLSPIRDDNGQVSGVLGLFHDVTEELEAQRLKDEFLTMASHELRTPTTTIRGLTEMLLRRIDRRGVVDAAELAKHLQAIRDEADRLSLIGADLLDVARLQQGRMELRRKAHDLRAIVQTAADRQRATLPAQAEHRIVVKVPAEPVDVFVERARVEQILENLLSNAIKYSPKGGSIVVELLANAAEAVVEVRDQGIGIPAQDLAKMFTPFYRASNASPLRYIGLGLGLYLSQNIAKAHGGRLALSSVEGAGTTIRLMLPQVAFNEG